MNKQVPPTIVIATLLLLVFFAFLLYSSTAGDTLAGKRLEKPFPVPEFTGKTADGKEFKLSDYKGKIVLLNFWATWCPPCIAEIPDLIKLQETYGPKGFVVVGLSQDDRLEIAAEFAKERGINYPILIQPDNVTAQLGVKALPTSILLDKEGNAVWGMEGTLQGVSQQEVIGREIERLQK